MVPELRREREASKLDIPELTSYIDGGEMVTERRRKMCESSCVACMCGRGIEFLMSDDLVKLIRNDPVFRVDDKFFLSREEAFDRAMEKAVHYIKLSKELELDNLEKNLLKL